jgi:hypothetical protein
LCQVQYQIRFLLIKTVTRHVSLVEQELATSPKQPNLPLVFKWGLC